MIITEIKKDDANKLVVEAKEYKGHKYVDIRVYWQHEDNWYPTKRGITITKKNKEALMEAINKGVALL
tara:strand:+ start:1297 stop:1500 length:204 start_codon:yes stop_codon:yes gene_type:complete